MNDKSLRYEHLWPAKPSIAMLTAAIALLFIFGIAKFDHMLFARLLLGAFALILLLISAGALIRTEIRVDGGGTLQIRKTIAGIPIMLHNFLPGEITGVRFDRQMSANPDSTISDGTNRSTPRFRIDLLYGQKKCFVVAGTECGSLSVQARRIAEAVYAPLYKNH